MWNLTFLVVARKSPSKWDDFTVCFFKITKYPNWSFFSLLHMKTCVFIQLIIYCYRFLLTSETKHMCVQANLNVWMLWSRLISQLQTQRTSGLPPYFTHIILPLSRFCSCLLINLFFDLKSPIFVFSPLMPRSLEFSPSFWPPFYVWAVEQPQKSQTNFIQLYTHTVLYYEISHYYLASLFRLWNGDVRGQRLAYIMTSSAKSNNRNNPGSDNV